MRTAVLLMAHGTPSSLAEMPDYLRIVRGGRPPSPELIEEMTHNYTAIGGRSPLTDITRAQAAALAERLGPSVPVAVGMRNWHPYIKEAMEQLAATSPEQIIGLPLAPQFSTLSVQKYMDAARAALPAGPTLTPVRSFHDHPLLLQAFAERVRAANAPPDETVVFTAHSLPKRVIDSGDVYADEVAATAKGVAALAGIAKYDVAYQSAGRTPEPWIGPDLSEFVAARAAQGQRAFLVVPIGFVCDHTEVLFDIDVQAARAAHEAGATLRRTESLNTSPTFIAALESIVRALLL
jgi:protoporphyrin/coproporphyrin ferrochelatase